MLFGIGPEGFRHRGQGLLGGGLVQVGGLVSHEPEGGGVIQHQPALLGQEGQGLVLKHRHRGHGGGAGGGLAGGVLPGEGHAGRPAPGEVGLPDGLEVLLGGEGKGGLFPRHVPQPGENHVDPGQVHQVALGFQGVCHGFRVGPEEVLGEVHGPGGGQAVEGGVEHPVACLALEAQGGQIQGGHQVHLRRFGHGVFREEGGGLGDLGLDDLVLLVLGEGGVRGGHRLAVEEVGGPVGLHQGQMAALAAQGGQEGGEDLPGVVMGGAVGGLPSHHRQVDGLVGGQGQGAFCGLGQGRGRLPAAAAGQCEEKGQRKGQDDSKGAFHGTFSFRGSVVWG